MSVASSVVCHLVGAAPHRAIGGRTRRAPGPAGRRRRRGRAGRPGAAAPGARESVLERGQMQSTLPRDAAGREHVVRGESRQPFGLRALRRERPGQRTADTHLDRVALGLWLRRCDDRPRWPACRAKTPSGAGAGGPEPARPRRPLAGGASARRRGAAGCAAGRGHGRRHAGDAGEAVRQRLRGLLEQAAGHAGRGRAAAPTSRGRGSLISGPQEAHKLCTGAVVRREATPMGVISPP